MGAFLALIMSVDNPFHEEALPSIQHEPSTSQTRALGSYRTSIMESAIVYNMNLEQALHTLGFSLSILSDLDQSLARVKEFDYSEEAKLKYDSSFKEIFTKQYKQLALKFHPDKNHEETKDAVGEKMDNLNMMKQIMENLHKASVEEKDFRYGLFAKVAFNFLHQNGRKCSSFINKNVAAELRNITIWRQSNLLYCRNEFLKKTQSLFDDIKRSIIKDFKPLVWMYMNHYCKHWISNLADLKYRCNNDGDLVVIKDEVEKLLKDNIVQLKLLIKAYLKEKYSTDDSELKRLVMALPIKNLEIKNELEVPLQESIDSDKCFIHPVIVYCRIMEELSACYSYNYIPFLDEMSRMVDKFKKNLGNIGERKLLHYIRGCSRHELERLRKNENIKKDVEITTFIEENSKVYSPGYGRSEATPEQMRQVVLVQILNESAHRLKEEFKEEKTWFRRIDEEIHQVQKHMQETEKKIGQETLRAEREIQRAKQEAQRAEQEALRADKLELKCTVIKLITQSFRKLKFDPELRNIIEDGEDDIVKEVVEHVMMHKSSPEQVLDSIMQTIQHNEVQIKTKGKIDDKLIEKAIEPFVTTVKAELSVNIEVNEDKLGLGAENFLS